jgi:hypothetical protein
MKRLALALLVAAFAGAVLIPATLGTTSTTSISGVGKIASGEGFRSFAFWASQDASGVDRGLATFGGIDGNQSSFLVMKINCLFVIGESALASGPMIYATDQSRVGKTALFGVVDGDMAVPPGRDFIAGDFTGELPSGLDCEQTRIFTRNPVVWGKVVIR